MQNTEKSVWKYLWSHFGIYGLSTSLMYMYLPGGWSFYTLVSGVVNTNVQLLQGLSDISVFLSNGGQTINTWVN